MIPTSIHPIHNPNQHLISTNNNHISDKLANSMPNGLLRVAETQTNRNNHRDVAVCKWCTNEGISWS